MSFALAILLYGELRVIVFVQGTTQLDLSSNLKNNLVFLSFRCIMKFENIGM